MSVTVLPKLNSSGVAMHTVKHSTGSRVARLNGSGQELPLAERTVELSWNWFFKDFCDEVLKVLRQAGQLGVAAATVHIRMKAYKIQREISELHAFRFDNR